MTSFGIVLHCIASVYQSLSVFDNAKEKSSRASAPTRHYDQTKG